MRESALDLSLVIACYNEERLLEESMAQIFRVLDHSTFSYEVIFVDDGSQDRTRELIDQTISAYPDKRITRIFHARNQGRGGAVADGFRAACGEVAGYIDIDLEVHARYIPACVLAIMDGADVATAERVDRFYWRGIVRWLMSHGYVWLEHTLLGIPIQDSESGFKFFRRAQLLPLLDEIRDTGWFWDTEVMARSYLRGYRIVEIPCLFERRFDKRSTVRPIADTIGYLRKLVAFRPVVSALRSRQP